MIRTTLRLLSVLSLVALSNPLWADDGATSLTSASAAAAVQPVTIQAQPAASAAQAGIAQMRAAIAHRYPATHVDSIRATPLPGIWEVVMGKNVAYLDASAKWFLFGHLVDMTTQTDVTALRMEEVNRVEFASLPLNLAIPVVHGHGSRRVALFEDPDCPYCKQLEQEIGALGDVTLYVYLFPLAGLHADAERKARNVWCSHDRPAAWRHMMTEGVVPPDRQCDTPFAQIAAIAKQWGIQGTPTLVAADGRRHAGTASAAELDHWLNVPAAGGQGVIARTEAPAGAPSTGVAK